MLSATTGKRQIYLVKSKGESKYDQKGKVSRDAGRVLLAVCLWKRQYEYTSDTDDRCLVRVFYLPVDPGHIFLGSLFVSEP
jgi:hypothetical protein